MPAPSSPPLLIGAVDASPFFSPIAHRCRRYQALLLPHSPTSIIGLWLMTRGCHLWLMSRSCHLLRCILAMHGRSVTPPPTCCCSCCCCFCAGVAGSSCPANQIPSLGPRTCGGWGCVSGGCLYVCREGTCLCVRGMPICVAGGYLFVWRRSCNEGTMLAHVWGQRGRRQVGGRGMRGA